MVSWKINQFYAGMLWAAKVATDSNVKSIPERTNTTIAVCGVPRSTFVSAHDGLRLHVVEYGDRAASALSVVCLPGLTRTTADFEILAPALAYGDPARHVIAIDSRGRGRSEYDVNPQNYNLAVELADVVTVLATLEIERAVFVGSSRGGILTMLLGKQHPSTSAGAVLHDIGPAIEAAGVARIKSYAGKMRQPRTMEEGAEIIRGLFAAQFPKLTPMQWLAAAQRTWKPQDGRLVLTYDRALAGTLADFDIEHPLPALWDEFDALARVPILVIRGANSDVLSGATVKAMQAHHPGVITIEVADQGHVPLLDSSELIGRIAEFIRGCDVARSNAERVA